MHKHPLLAVVILWVVFATLAGCSTLGVPAPQNFNEKALAATATANTASELTFTLLKARKITPDESDRYIASIENFDEAIALARAIRATDPIAAQDRLDFAIRSLELLLAELRARQ